jgi:glycosyltransferase involved in cell wall biosynthesis
MADLPRISVITVTLNAAATFSETSQSILDQDYPDLEWIVVDGGSVDGTVDMIRAVSDRVNRWITEPDKGLYDAMNKGIGMATGTWINFMNAGDTFASQTVISDIFRKEIVDAEIIYGGCMIRYPGLLAWKAAGEPERFPKEMPVCHQSVFIRTQVVRSCLFDLQFPIGADYHQLARLFASGKRFHRMEIPIAIYDIRGNSNKKMVASACEHYRIARQVFGLSWMAHITHIFFIMKVSLISLAYLLLPSNWVQSARNHLISARAFKIKKA